MSSIKLLRGIQKTVRTNYVLIDYENVQPTDLALLEGGPFKVQVFLGAHQTKVPVAFAAELQRLGPNAKYVPLASAGPNAVDFHIAYFIGVLSTQDSSASFHVISGDQGFDPLLEYLRSDGVAAHRYTSIASILNSKPAISCDSLIETVVARLKKQKTALPGKEKNLRNTLNLWFSKELPQQRISELLSELRAREIVKTEGTKLTYKL